MRWSEVVGCYGPFSDKGKLVMSVLSGYGPPIAISDAPRVVAYQEQVFLYELLMSDEERRMYNAVMNSPTDLTARQMYSDFLNEKGRANSAAYILGGFIPGCSVSFPSKTFVGSGSRPLSGGMTPTWSG